MANNRIDVVVSASTAELKKGLDKADADVKASVKSIESAGKGAKFDFDTSGVKRQFDDLGSNIRNKFRSLGDDVTGGLVSKFDSAGKSIAGGMTRNMALVGGAIASAVAVAGFGLAKLTNSVGQNAKELVNQARIANTTTTEFQEWAFASKSVGVEQDKLADIMKDVNDKFGDFMQTGGGEMADFFEKVAPKVGVTAKEFQGLSSPQILGKYYDTLQKANLSQAEMTFYLESIANDATVLSPLLANNATKLKQYADQAQKLGVILDEDAIAKTREFSTALGLIQQTIESVFNRMAARAAPELTRMADRFLDFATRSRDAIDSSVTAIVVVFESLFAIADTIFSSIGEIWATLTVDIGDGSRQQSSFLNSVAEAMKGLAAAAVYLKVGVDVAFSGLRAVVATVMGVIRSILATARADFDQFRDSIRYSLDDLSARFRMFGNIARNVLSFNFSAAKASWANGLSDIGNLASNHTSRMISRQRALNTTLAANRASVSQSWNNAKNKVFTSVASGQQSLFMLKQPQAPKKTAQPNTRFNTFNQNTGVGTGVKTSNRAIANDAKREASLKRQTQELEKHQKILNINDRVKANAEKHNFAGIEKKYQLPAGTLSAIHMIESRGNANAYNKSSGAQGGFQFLPGTAKQYGVKDRTNLSQAAEGAGKYLNYLLRLFKGNLEKSVRAYHAGEGNVQRGTGMGKYNNKYWDDYKSYMAGMAGVSQGSDGVDSSAYEKSLQEQQKTLESSQKEAFDLAYKYASSEQKIVTDLGLVKQRISENLVFTNAEKTALMIAAESEAKDQIAKLRQSEYDQGVRLLVEELEVMKAIHEGEIQAQQELAQHQYDLEITNLEAMLAAGKVSNAEKIRIEKELETQLYEVKRDGLLNRLSMEQDLSKFSGKDDAVRSITREITQLDYGKESNDANMPKLMSEADTADFEQKFGGLTTRISQLWDNGIQSMMNGTLTWSSATKAVLTDMAGFAIQTASKEMQARLKLKAISLAKEMGFIGATTAAEAAGQTAQTGAVIAGETARTSATGLGVVARLAMKAGEAIKSIAMYALEAMAGAFKAMVSIPYIGPVLAVGAGAAAFGLVSGIAGKIKSARGGYDIPRGVNPMTQLHEEEMVLPSQQANTIRKIGESMLSSDDKQLMAGGATGAMTVNIQAFDSQDIKRFMRKNGNAMADSLKNYGRNFGK